MRIAGIIMMLSVLGSQIWSRAAPKDLTIMGIIIKFDGLGRVGLGIFDCLKNDLRIALNPNGIISMAGITTDLTPFLKKEYEQSKVMIVTDPLFHFGRVWSEKHLAQASINIAYSMTECSRIPEQWSFILNTYFDAVVVPDPYLEEVYRTSGVVKPIFVIPCRAYLEEFLAQPPKQKPHDVFVFGCSGTFIERKNHLRLLEAFAQEFGNDQRVKLVLHGRQFAGSNVYEQLVQTLKQLRLTNVEIINKTFSQHEYVSFMASLDCYVLISQGEGFSFTPLEALALAMPCIVSDNAAHKTLCKTKNVRAVPTSIQVLARYPHEPSLESGGYFFDCLIQEVRGALRDVYLDYNHYLKRARKGRSWVKRYLPESLRPLYLSLVKPQKVILSDKNVVTAELLETNDPLLYEKYKNLA